MSIDSPSPIDAVVLPGSVSRLSGGLFTSVRRLSESMNDQGIVRARVVGNRDAHTDDDLSQWQHPPILLDAAGRREMAGELFRWLQQNDPDLVHPQFIWSYASLATMRWHRADRRRRHVISPRGMLDPWALTHSRWKKRSAGLLFESKHLRTAACIHALCASEARAVRKFGLTNPICLIPNGIDVPSDDDLSRLKTVERAADGRRTMLFIGRIHQKKGLLQLISAWGKSKRQLSDWRLVIAGWDDGNHQRNLSDAVADSGLQSSISFAGSLYGQEKALALASADAFVLPSFSEGLPMAILEAWAHRLPVLMTEECNLPIGFESEAALAIQNSPQSLAQSLTEFATLSDKQLVAMGERGRHLVASRFQWQQIARQMVDVYQWTLGRRDRPACVDLG